MAFAKAVGVGAHHLETDVHVSADGVAIISHDRTLTRVVGRDIRVDQLTASELRRINLGDGQGFATLAETLDAFPEARFNIDVKAAGAVQPAVDAIRLTSAQGRVLVTSFSDARRRRTVASLPGVATSAASASTAALLAASRLGVTAVVRRILESVDAVQVPEVWKGVRIITPTFVRRVQSAGVEVHVWTVNDPVDMVRLLDFGVDGLITDRADLAVPLVLAHTPNR